MKMKDLCTASERLVPLDVAEGWDNVGLLLGDPDADVQRVLLAIDLTEAVLAEALDTGCHAVIAYHPPIFQGLKRITAGSVVYRALRAGLCVYSPHTALDVAEGGTNDVLADALGLRDRVPLKPLAADVSRGMGRRGSTDAVALGELAARLKANMGLQVVMVAGEPERTIRTVALCAGAGGELLEDALRARVDLYVTGELRHHDALKALTRGCAVIMTLHSNSERRALPSLRNRLTAACQGVTFSVSTRDRDPFHFA